MISTRRPTATHNSVDCSNDNAGMQLNESWHDSVGSGSTMYPAPGTRSWPIVTMSLPTLRLSFC